MTIDVGKIIEQSILSCSQGRATQHLVHPSLIYQLCVQAGVGSVDEEEQMPLPPINNYTMELLEKTSKAGRKGKAASPTPDTAPPEQEEPFTSVGPDSERPTPHATTAEMPTPVTPAPLRPDSSSPLEATLRGIQIQLDELKKGQKMMFDELMKGQRKMKKKLDYMMDFNLGIAKTMYRAKLIDNFPEIHLPSMPSDSSWSSTEKESEEGTRRDEAGNDGDEAMAEDTASKAAMPEDIGSRAELPVEVGSGHLTGDSHDEDSGAGSHYGDSTDDSSDSQSEEESEDHGTDMELVVHGSDGQAVEVGEAEETSGQAAETSGKAVEAEEQVSTGREEKKDEVGSGIEAGKDD